MPALDPRQLHRYFKQRPHVILPGLCIVIVAISIGTGTFVQLSGYHVSIIDRRDSSYSSVTARRVTRNAAMPPFVVNYPLIQNPSVNTQIHAYTTQLVNNYLHERSDRRDATEDEQLQIGYAIRWYDTRTITIDFTHQKQRTGKTWDRHTETLTFDLVTNQQVTPRDIVKNPLKLGGMLYDHRRSHNPANLSPAELIDLLDLDTTKIHHAIPYGDTIAFTYTISNRTETIAIKKTLLTESIHPAYLTATGDQTRKNPPIQETILTTPNRDEPLTANSKKLALTFDDGPGEHTPRLLDTLAKYRARATFFVVGKNVAPHSTTIKRFVADGHEIGNHTWAHSDLRVLPGASIASQINDTQTVIQQVSNYTPRHMRPPYGFIDAHVSSHLQGLQPVLWTVDTRDWHDRDADVIYARIMAGAHPGGIILLHDIHPSSVDAAIRAIRQLRADGWHLVTVSEL